MKQTFSVACLAAAVLLVGLAGCERDSYSDWVKYKFREDPVIVEASATTVFGQDTFTLDRPGQLPVMRLDDIYKNKSHLLFPFADKYKNTKAELLRDPADIPAEVRKAMEAKLTEYFGTPASPKVKLPEDAEDPSVIAKLKLDEAILAKGSGLYREHCLHCHGVTGDGRGPTSRWVNPHPRDYRAMKFKFQSVDRVKESNLPPHRDDLLRTLRQGLEGTSMPSFGLLSQDKLEALASYVIHLSLRGNSENLAIKDGFERNRRSADGKLVVNTEMGPVEYIAPALKQALGFWAQSQDPKFAIQPAPYPYKVKKMENGKEVMVDGKVVMVDVTIQESSRRGWKLFVGDESDPEVGKVAKGFSCVSCHTDYGRQAQFRWDEWGTMVRPNNLTLGVHRGGRRPIDLYYRIHSGINGSGMTIFGNIGAGEPNGERHIWDLVNFVQNLSYPAMRDKLGLKIN